MRQLTNVGFICVVVSGSGGCTGGADSVVAETRGHVRALASMQARLPPTPANMPLLRDQIETYRLKNAAKLVKLRGAAAKLVESKGKRDQLAVDAYCALERMLDPEHGPGKVVSRRGGYFKRIDEFDAAAFGLAPREAVWIDPQHRLLLETAWEALEDAGQSAELLAGLRGGVFVGQWTNDFEMQLYRATPNVDVHMTTGSGRCAACGRLSFVFNLRGPSVAVDTGCSSALVAVHLACASLRADECDLARGDSDLDGNVGINDFLAVLAKWGVCGPPCPEVADLDGSVGILDFLNVLANWG